MEMETYLHRLHRKMKAEIPLEILSCEILSRLPVKSVLRFKCVSKQWHSLLTTQMFKKAHLDHITDDYHQNPNKLLLLYAPTPYEFRTIDCEAPTDGLTRNRSLPFLSRPANIEILASFHGLVCVGRIKNGDSSFFFELIIWNPSTGEYKTVSKTNHHYECNPITGIVFGLYYSSCEDDYKLLHVTNYNRRVYIYSLKYDSWRKLDGSIHNLDELPYFRRERWNCWSLCTWLDKNLYFITQCLIGEGSDPWSYSIIKFDTNTEKFTQIQTPTSKIYTCTNYFLTVQRGKMHLCVKYNIASTKTCISLWSLNGDGDSWTHVRTYFLMKGLISSLKPLHLMNNNNWLMILPYPNKSSLYKYDLEKSTKRNEESSTLGEMSGCTLIERGILGQVRYIETLVSPNQYMNN